MKCIYCGSDKVTYDDTSSMYYCSECNHLFEENDNTEINSEEDLNGFSLIMLSIVQMIPILNIIVAIIICDSSVKNEYKKMISYKVISNMIVSFIVFLCLLQVILNNRFNIIENILDRSKYLIDYMSNSLSTEKDFHIIEGKSFSEILNSIDDVETNTNYVDIDSIKYLDNVVLSGDKILSIIEDNDNKICSFHIQTKSIAGKYGTNVYRIYGYITIGYDNMNTLNNYFYKNDTNINLDFCRGENNKLVYGTLNDVYNSDTIFYINSKSTFRVNILRNEKEDFIGFSFTEL